MRTHTRLNVICCKMWCRIFFCSIMLHNLTLFPHQCLFFPYFFSQFGMNCGLTCAIVILRQKEVSHVPNAWIIGPFYFKEFMVVRCNIIGKGTEGHWENEQMPSRLFLSWLVGKIIDLQPVTDFQKWSQNILASNALPPCECLVLIGGKHLSSKKPNFIQFPESFS